MGKCESDRPALLGKPSDSQQPFLSCILLLLTCLTLFLCGFYIIITPRPLPRPNQPANQLRLTHGGANRPALWTDRTHLTPKEASLPVSVKRKDYKGSERDTLNSHSRQTLFSLRNDRIKKEGSGDESSIISMRQVLLSGDLRVLIGC